VDVVISGIIRQLRRKANVMIYDAERLDLPYGKQRGEEIHALLDILEKSIEKQNANRSVSGSVLQSVEGTKCD
jgi:hypothetical protein